MIRVKHIIRSVEEFVNITLFIVNDSIQLNYLMTQRYHSYTNCKIDVDLYVQKHNFKLCFCYDKNNNELNTTTIDIIDENFDSKNCINDNYFILVNDQVYNYYYNDNFKKNIDLYVNKHNYNLHVYLHHHILTRSKLCCNKINKKINNLSCSAHKLTLLNVYELSYIGNLQSIQILEINKYLYGIHLLKKLKLVNISYELLNISFENFNKLNKLNKLKKMSMYVVFKLNKYKIKRNDNDDICHYYFQYEKIL